MEDRIRGLRERLADEGITHVAIFGSRARGDHRQDSDLDLLIEVDEERPFTLLDLVGIQHVIGDETGLPVNIQMRRSLTPTFEQTVASDIVDIF